MNEGKAKLQTEQLDKEWIELMKEAKKLGLSFADIQQFLQHGRVKM
ncbi:anti-repressor SinI family protein [Bacillus sp. SA1-12]|nr:anti-repressor SinI family protein [Bacillus sp. SA1-12]